MESQKKCSSEMREIRKRNKGKWNKENSKTADSTPTINNHFKCAWSRHILLKDCQFG